MTITAADVFGFAGNLLGVLGLVYFVGRYSLVRWERARLGQAMMAGSVAVLALSGVALFYRASVLFGWPFIELTWLKVGVGIAWAGVGVAYIRHGNELRRAQREARTTDLEGADT